MSRRKFTSKFKTKVVLEALKERNSMAELAQKHKLQPAQITKWKLHYILPKFVYKIQANQWKKYS